MLRSGGDPCRSFTGSVAKDGSCDGVEACVMAEIDVVSGGSCVGENRTCYYARIGAVSGGSCVGR